MKNGLFKKWLAAALCVLALGSTAALAEPDSFGLGNGHNGDFTVSAAATVINSYAQVTAPLAPGDTQVPVGSCVGAASCFSAGDLVMVLQTTGIVPAPTSGAPDSIVFSSTEPVGRWEFARLSSVAAGTLTLSAPLLYSYAANVTQVIRVPEYANLTITSAGRITATPWNGGAGGVIAFLATGTVSNAGQINANAAGFRGGAYVDDPSAALGCSGLDEPAAKGAQKGEGISSVSYGPSQTGRGNVGNGAGGGVCFNSGGGGGGNSAAGGIGGRSDGSTDGSRAVGGLGGSALIYSLYDHVTLGGGGGAGHGSDGTGVAGGRGGGAIFIRANQLTGSGTIQASGGGGGASGTDGASGGGAGGSFYLRFVSTAACGSVSANGGVGGTVNSGQVGPGGGGAGGRALFQAAPGATCNINLIGAAPGNQQDPGALDGLVYGARAGGNGTPSTLTYGLFVPSAPTVTSPANGSVSTNRRPLIQGTGPIKPTSSMASVSVIIYLDGVEVGRTGISSSGDYFLPYPSALANLSEGPHTVYAVVEAESLQSPKSVVNTFTVDLTPPPAPVVSTPRNGDVLNTGNPAITGTAEANSTVTVYIDGSVAGTVTADASGKWSYTPTTPLKDAVYTVKATAKDAAGNVSVDSNTNTFTVDTTPPAAPTVTAPAEGSHTNNTRPVITGTAEPGSTVTVILNGTAQGTVTANASGNWSYTPATALPDGDYAVKATAKDAAGNVSPTSNVRNFTVDTLPPPAPVVQTPVTGSVLNNPRPTITGTAEKNSTLTLTLNGPGGISIVVLPVDATGAWSYTPTTNLLDGTYTVKATATDSAGNTSVDSNTNTFIIDTTAPVAPTVTAPAEGAQLSVAQPVITGTAEPHSTVTVILNGTVQGTVTADASGNWSYTPATALPDGDYAVKATAKDAAGNVSPESNVRHFTVDTLPPPAPVVQTPATGSVVNTHRPLITGTAEKNSTVTVYIDGAVAGTTTADGSGNWSFTPTTDLADGSYKVKATSKDAAGNVSVDSNQNTFTVDTVKPVAPTVDAPGEGALLNTATPLITGTAEKNSTVTVYIDGKAVGSVTADGSGNWSYTPSTGLLEGAHEVKATSTDAAGNVSDESNVRHFNVDTVAPVAPTVTVPSEGAHVGTPTPALSGMAEPGSTVTVFIDGSAVGTVTADGSGNWSYTPATPLADGSHEVKATATDATGNTSPESNVRTFIVDTVAPVAPTVTAPGEGDHLMASPAAITGSAEPGSTVTVTLDGKVVGTVTADSSGNWSYTPAAPLADGAHQVTATSTDAAGNTSPSSDVRHFSVDTVVPDTSITAAPPSLTNSSNAAFEFGSTETGVSYECRLDGAAAFTACAASETFTGLADGKHTLEVRARDTAGNVDPTPASYTWTVDTTAPAAPVVTAPAATVDTLTPVISGTAEPGSTVTVTLDGAVVGTVKADASGNWSYTPSTPLAVGSHDVVASATDDAGNTSPASPSHPFTVVQDTKAPETTITSGPSGTTSEHGATFELGSDEPGVTYECSLDGAAFTPCTSPVSFTNLSEGEHTFQVRARDAAGNVDATPASRTWTIAPETPGNGGGDIAFLGDGIGCSATGGDSSLVLMGLGTFLALARRRRR